jgi:CBS domain containing-hemolysin-like protein
MDPFGYLGELASYGWQVGVITVCLLGLAFSSLAEAALMRVEASRARQLAGERRRGAGSLVRLLEARQEVLNSLLLAINVCVIIASAYTTQVTIALSRGSTRWVPLSAVVMIAFILVVCEVAPKTYGVRRAEAVGLAAAPVLGAVHALLSPAGRLLYPAALWLIRRAVVPVIGGRATPPAPVFSDEEVMDIVAAGEAQGGIEQEEKEMIHGVIEFADKVTREVMRPRTDMVCLPAAMPLSEAAQVTKQTGYSRMPVYQGSVDHIVGIIYARDMVSALQLGGAGHRRGEAAAEGGRVDGGGLTAGEVARKPALVVPESKKLDEVLRFMQRNRVHMAIVIDEYGGTAGLVTIDDLLEEIFGEIRDEHDFEAEPIRVLDERTLVANARVSRDDLEEVLGVSLPEGEFDSVGGFILDQLGRLPAVGETVCWADLEFTVEAVSANRIERVRVVRRGRGSVSPPYREVDDEREDEAS